jgi:hypothetical protein
MPRRTRLTPAVSKALCDAMREGYTLPNAAAVVGVSAATVREWIRRGEGADDRPTTEPYATFATAMARARAECEMEMVASIQSAAEAGQWRAAAWFLERTHPERWGRGAHRIQVRNVAGRYEAASPFTLSALLDVLAERKAGEAGR